MREKVSNLSTWAVLGLGAIITLLFIGVLNGTGVILEKIPGLSGQTEYLMQGLAEIITFVVFFILVKILGYEHIFKEKHLNWLVSLYFGGFFVVYILFNSLAQVMNCVQTGNTQSQPAFNIVFFVTTMFLIGLVEELVFRGIILNMFLDHFPKTTKGILTAIILDGVFFGLMHLSNIMAGVQVSSALIQVLSTCFLGILFAVIYAFTRNFWLVVVFHALVDFGSLISSGIFTNGGLVDTINTFSAINLIGVVVLLIPSIVLLRKSNLIKMESMYNGEELVIDEKEASFIAIVSLVLGILGLVLSCAGYTVGFGVLGAIAANISKKAKHDNNGMAIAGLVTSIIAVVVSLVMFVVMCYVLSIGQSGIMDMFR